MANLEKIVKLTQSQYDTLKNGGTVKGETGLNDEWLYLVPNDSNGGGWEYVADIVAYDGSFDTWVPTFDVSILIGKRLLISFYIEDKDEFLNTIIIPVCSQNNVFSFSFYSISDEVFGIMHGLFDVQSAPAAPFGHYIGGGCWVGACGTPSSFPNASERQHTTDKINNFGIKLKIFMQDV